MLKIRPEHLTALADQQASGFTARMMLHLREVFPAEVARLDEAKLFAFIEKVCAQGEEWGITKEPFVERLIELFVSFEQLRRNPLPQWISEIVRQSGRNGVRVLLMLEKRLQFQEGGKISAESVVEGAGVTFYRKVDEAFYNELKQENGGTLPPGFMNAGSNARTLTIAPADRVYRRKWLAFAAQMRKSRAVPKKILKSPSTQWLAKTSGAKFPPVLLPTKGGAITKAPITSHSRRRD
jgi:hypothetical protein